MFRTSTMMEEKPHRNRIGKTYRIKAPIAISVRIIAQQNFYDADFLCNCSFASFFHCRFISSVLEFLCLQLTVYAGRGRSSFGLIFKRFGSCSCSSWCAVVTRLVRVSVQLGVSRS
ncbi:uncharacterized protein LOC127118970 isoform X2 [Lathyrus oleraceus]|uniref:uncharacterized protein LOC127118970 isoform X2 n=1 Tax=Pisum sativum TaxID=3888 RepID=UPI0021CDEC51|nr:uncharacterized protein LOC127118970 isoform X2 [Pisum sativum]